MHCSNAGLLALWLILCTQGHEDFNLSSWHCRCVCVCLHLCFVHECICSCLRSMFMCMHLFVCFLLFFHFTFTKSPILMSCHWQLLPTLALTLQDEGVRVCYFVPLYASKWGGEIIKMCKNKHKMFIVA